MVAALSISVLKYFSSILTVFRYPYNRIICESRSRYYLGSHCDLPFAQILDAPLQDLRLLLALGQEETASWMFCLLSLEDISNLGRDMYLGNSCSQR